MKAHQACWKGVVIAFLLAGCATESTEFRTLKEQVRLQDKQIIDLKNRQNEQQAKLEILDNSFKILGDKAEENAQRLDTLASQKTRVAPAPPPIRSTPLPPKVPKFQKTAPAPGVIKPPPVPPPPESVAAKSPLSAADLYRSALDSFTQENYQQSVLEFEEFVANYPDHDLADNAQYWIGECYYAQKNFEQAALEFEKVEKHFGSGNKAVAALLKKGLALKEVGRHQQARDALEQVIRMYPMADEAAIAKKRLSQWQ